jgi:hypothetical protein
LKVGFVDNSPHAIHHTEFTAAQFTAHNSPRTIHRGTNHRAKFTVAQFTAVTIHRRHNSPRKIDRAQLIAKKSKIPVVEFLILLGDY